MPDWLERYRLGDHGPSAWTSVGTLRAARRGQELVADVGDDGEATGWVERVGALIRTGGEGATGGSDGAT